MSDFNIGDIVKFTHEIKGWSATRQKGANIIELDYRNDLVHESDLKKV